MTSLRSTLLSLILSKGILSYGEMCEYVNEQEYKIATAERRLRGLCAPISEKGLPQTPLIRPVMKIGKRRGGEYIAAWEKIPENEKVETREIRGFVTINGERIQIFK